MFYSPPTILSSNELPVLVAHPLSEFPEADTVLRTDNVSALRDALVAGTHPPASILHAAADAARILTGASGVAIAVRTRGLVACRARSGDIAPELGAPVNVDSGISGECLRTATILICSDTETDCRVDPDVCRILGIRSIAVVPLRGPMGIAGILEAFSVSPGAFGDEQINTLRGLAEIAESAYERECRAREMAPTSKISAARRQIFSALAIRNKDLTNQILGEPYHTRRRWIIAIAAITLLLVSGVLWLSWRDPTPESTAAETSQPANPAEIATTTSAPAVIAKPEAGTAKQAGRLRTVDVLKNAADIQITEEGPRAASIAETESAIEAEGARNSAPAPISNVDTAPPIRVAASDSPKLLSALASPPATMPSLETRISQGVTQSTLLHQVNPIYPTQARVQRLAGSVILDATIGQDGKVKDIKLVSGLPLLAASATDAVRQWRYSPLLLNGTPIEVQKRITIVFKLP